MKSTLKKYFPAFVYFYRYLGIKILLVVVLSILVGVLDGVGLTMFLPLLQMADSSSSSMGVSMGNLRFLIDGMEALNIKLTLKVALLILFVFFALKGLATYLARVYQINIQQYFIASLRLKLTQLFTRYSFKNFVSADIGKIQNVMTGEVSRVSFAFQTYVGIIQNSVLVIVYLFFLVMVDWKFTLMVGLGGGLANFIYASVFKNTKKVSKHLSKSNSVFQGFMIQFIQNFKYLKATGLLASYEQRLQSSIKEVEGNNKKIGILNAIVSASREPILIGVVCLVILLQITLMGGSLAAILVSLLFFYRALTAIIAIQNSYNTFLGYHGSIIAVTEFEEELKNGREINGKAVFSTFQKQMKIQSIDFGYHKTDLILKDITMRIVKNQTIALVGESGSGKTTLVNIISGLLPSTGGQFLIDGKEIFSLDKNTYQSRIGYIAQEPVIFSDTIFNNVSFWAEPTAANKQRFEQAIQKAAISDFINALADKEETLLGNNGINLSGGQKQRISIARELYKDIDILILDEATSALDSETEKEIQENIERLKGQFTLIIIAHRLSTIKHADMVCLMDKGRIIDIGSFEYLSKKNDRFKRMVELQEM